MRRERQICIAGCEEPKEPTASFRTVLIDPPWPERGSGKCVRGAQKHYALITTRAEMLRTIVQAPVWRPATDAHMYLWSTDNYLDWAMWLIPALGFKMHRTLPWVKPGRMGLGQYFRGCHELLLFATRGRGKAVSRPGTFRTDALVGAERPNGRVHSAKPLAAYELIEARSKGPYAEIFARGPARDGWTTWGNEAKPAHDSAPGDQHAVSA